MESEPHLYEEPRMRRQRLEAKMGSFTQLTYHVIFSTKYRQSLIVDAVREELYRYVGGTIRNLKGHLIEIGGVEDHVHVLANFSPTLAVADVIRDIKANASR